VSSFQTLALLHAAAGFGVGCALSFTHGSIGRSANPHRLFALVNVVLGIFAVAFLGGVPQLIQRSGAQVFFIALASTMAIAAAVTALTFPSVADEAPRHAAPAVQTSIPRAAWFVIGVVMCLTLNQAMVFSFVERIGAARGFGVDKVNAVLIALGLVNLLPGLLAALLQSKWSPVAVGIGGPVGQALLALVMSSTLVFLPYAVAAALYVSMVIFTHTFLFGLLSRLDPSGRAVAATPAMMMIGSCIGPALGGGLVAGVGYPGLGWAASVVSLLAVALMLKVRRELGSTGPALSPAHA
jgi:predicted MFS family arabinose efflux permease